MSGGPIVRPYVVIPRPSKFDGLVEPFPLEGAVVVWAAHPRKAAEASGFKRDGVVVFQLEKMRSLGGEYLIGPSRVDGSPLAARWSLWGDEE